MLWTVAAAVTNPLIFVAILSAINNLIVLPEPSTTSRANITRNMSPTTAPTGGIHFLDDDVEVDDVRTQIAGSSSLTLVLAVASFAPKCKSLLADVTSLVENEEEEHPAQPAPVQQT